MLSSADELSVPPDAARARLRAAYLPVWGGYAPIERLEQACTLALPLGALHQAVS